jgi:hypothetical protein
VHILRGQLPCQIKEKSRHGLLTRASLKEFQP